VDSIHHCGDSQAGVCVCLLVCRQALQVTLVAALHCVACPACDCYVRSNCFGLSALLCVVIVFVCRVHCQCCHS
jgi:hypothetical protein